MTEDLQQIEEQLSNEILKEVFQELHDTVVDNINTFSVINKLFAAKVISTDDLHELQYIKNPREKCTRLLIILHRATNPRIFIEMREAIKKEESYEWLVEKIDEKYLMVAVARVDVAELNLVIGDLRKDNVAVKTENTRLMKENAKMSDDIKRLSKENATLTTKISNIKVDNERLSTANAKLTKENSKLNDDNKRLCLKQSEYEKTMIDIVDKLRRELESVRKPRNVILSVVISVAVVSCLLVWPYASTLNDPDTSRDTDVLDKRRLHNNPQLLFTLDQPPTDSWLFGFVDVPRGVSGLVTLDKYLYVVYDEYNKVQVFDCEDRFKKIKDIIIKEMKDPSDMVGSSVTSQLFISEWGSDVIWRVDSKTGVSDVFVNTGHERTRLSLVDNRLLVSSPNLLLIFDIVSGERTKKIPLTEDFTRYDVKRHPFVYHAIESNRDSFFVSHGTLNNNTVSEIDSEGRVIRVFDNKQQLDCGHLASDSVGRLFVSDWDNKRVVLFDEHLNYERILIDKKQLDDARPRRLTCDKKNNRLTVGLFNGHVKIFEY